MKIEKIKNIPRLKRFLFRGDFEFIGSPHMDCSSYDTFKKELVNYYKDWVDTSFPGNSEDNQNPCDTFTRVVDVAKVIYIESGPFRFKVQPSKCLTLPRFMYAHALASKEMNLDKKGPYLYTGLYVTTNNSIICKFNVRYMGDTPSYKGYDN